MVELNLDVLIYLMHMKTLVMIFLKNKYFLRGAIVKILIVISLSLLIKMGLHEPSIIDKKVAEDIEIPELSSPPQKEKEKVPERLILNLDDLDVIKNSEQELEKSKAPGIRQDTIQENTTDGTLGKKDDGTTLYKKGKITIRGKTGFSELPEKDDSLDELLDKSEIKGDLGVEF